jgi:hypothetical protein
MNSKSLAILVGGALTHWHALAHEGHGLEGGAHWHATDVLGFVGAGLVVALVWAINKRK